MKTVFKLLLVQNLKVSWDKMVQLPDRPNDKPRPLPVWPLEGRQYQMHHNEKMRSVQRTAVSTDHLIYFYFWMPLNVLSFDMHFPRML